MIVFATEKDAYDIAKLHISGIRATYKEIYSDSYMDGLDIEEYTDAWIKYINRCDCRTLVYKEENEICGFAAVCLFNMDDEKAILDYFHVKKALQNKGIGSALFEYMKKMLCSEGIFQIVFHCAERNLNAQKFYLHKGAQYFGSYYTDNEGIGRFNNIFLLSIDDNLNDNKNSPSALGLEDEYIRLKNYAKGEFILYGAGNYYNMFIQRMKGASRPKYIFDNNEKIQGLFVNGIEIVKPHRTELPVIITSSKCVEIEQNLKQLGCKSYVAFYPWHDYGDL